MKFSIYSTESNEVIAVISAESNEACENKADELNFLGADEYGATYSDMSENETTHTEYVSA